MRWYNGTPVGDGILPDKEIKYPQFGSEDCAIFMTYGQLEKKWNRRKIKSGKRENKRGKEQ